MKKLIYFAVLAAALVAIAAPQAWAAESDDDKFKMHGEVRFRGEYSSNLDDLDDDFDDQGLFWPYRVRLAVEGQFSKNVSAWIEVQNGGVAGGNFTSINDGGIPSFFRFGSVQNDGEGVELYQGSMTLDKLWSDRFSLTIGRQELVLGNELLLGDFDFYTGLSHDGATGRWEFDKVDVTVWYFRTNEGSVSNIAGSAPPGLGFIVPSPVDGGQDFYGGYATWHFKEDQDFDFYLMQQDYHDANGMLGGGDLADIATVGARYGREIVGENGFYWNIEYATQFGTGEFSGGQATEEDAGGDVIEAWFGYNFHNGNNDHKVYGRYSSASGDDPNSADFDGFIGVAGDVHNRLGRGDWFALDTFFYLTEGITAWSVGYNGFYNDRHELGVAYWDYSVEDDTGLLSDEIGEAIDLWYGFNYTKNVAFELSYSTLSPGDFFTSGTPPDDDVTRIYGQARLRF
jgi:hypothetical protein